jgi:uncharacterized protein YbjT (DUF2867 family)
MSNETFLVLGATGKTGRRVAERLRAAGTTVRTAARRGADVRFDWDDVTTHDAALQGATAVYLVPPTLRTDYAGQVKAFIDRARSAGVRHVTFLSARGVDLAPPDVPPRAVELHLAGADDIGHAIVRPGWFMHNFSEGYFRPSADGSIFAQVAERIAAASGRRIAYVDVSVQEWVAREVAGGMPENYAGLLAMLLDEGVRVGAGAAVTDDVERVTGHAPRSLDEYVARHGPSALRD